MSRNDKAISYINKFLSKDINEHALLISGRWGSGKTYFISKHIITNHSSCIYISVNGVSDINEVRRRLLYAAYPILGDKSAQALGSLARSALGIFRFKTELKIEDLIGLENFKSIIVDDLERSQIPIDELLGFLNDFVEHDKKHLIILANEEELREKSAYLKNKEKIIGFTILIEPDVEEVISSIIKSLDSKFALFIDTNREKIRNIFTISRSGNLRILKQTIYEFQSIFNILKETPELSDASILEFLNLFLPLSMSYKIGDISNSDITERNLSFSELFNLKSDSERPKSGFEKLQDSYKSIDLSSSLMSNNFLCQIICDGYLDIELLIQSKQDVLARIDANASPEWRNIWYFMTSSPEVLDISIKKFKSKFANRDYIDAGTILHAFGILLMLSKASAIRWSNKRIVKEGERYIDDLRKNGKLRPWEGDYVENVAYGSAHGLGFAEADSREFSHLYNYWKNSSAEVRNETILSDLIKCILNLDEYHEEFSRIITQSDRQPNAHNFPIMVDINNVKFVRSLLSSQSETQLHVTRSIKTRYEHNPATLQPEIDWIIKTGNLIRNAAGRMSALQRHRVLKLLEWNWPVFSK